jgi:proteasome lid subunit RPN8/RPN11
MTTMQRPRPDLPRPRPRPPDDLAPRRLVLAPPAWLKWQYLCHAGPTEVAGFGLSSGGDPLYLDDVLVVRQRAGPMTVVLDDTAVADLFDGMVDAGVPPSRFARVWLHTHPGASAVPSPTDEATFDQAFGRCDWAVMTILSRAGRTSARLRFAAGPGGSIELPTAVDWAAWPAVATDAARPLADRIGEWRREYATCVQPDQPSTPASAPGRWLSAALSLAARPGAMTADPFLAPFFVGGNDDLD